MLCMRSVVQVDAFCNNLRDLCHPGRAYAGVTLFTVQWPNNHEMTTAEWNCQECGACCASFRVDFALEELETEGGRVPAGLAEPVNASLCRLRGTDHVPARCAALTGRVGERVACGIYEWRPSPCREFEAGSDACAQARRRHRLPA